MNIIIGVLKESYLLFNRMAPYLLFGFFFAGILHIFIKTETIARHLGKSTFLSVIKAALFGIPLPLCSCSVIPAAMSLKKEGASRGAVLSFLISAPTTGVDSILATYSLLGGIFTVYRIIASFVTGSLAGILANLFIKKDEIKPENNIPKCKMCCVEEEHAHGAPDKIKGIFTYAFGDLIKDTGSALLLGVLIGGAIAYFLPETFIESYLGSGILAMFIMLLVGIPMYVCATASIPIAAALILKGLSPGAAFVFLVAGPATNIVTMTVVARNMGKKTLAIYLGSIAFCSVVLGLFLNVVYTCFCQLDSLRLMLHQHEVTNETVGIIAGVILFLIIVYNFIKRKVKFYFKKSLILLLSAAVIAGAPQASFSQDPSASDQKYTSRQIYKFVNSYITYEIRDTGTFEAYDPVVKRTRRLALIKIQPNVFPEGDLYVVRANCRDGDTGEYVDVNFNIKADEDGKLAVDKITIYAVGGVKYKEHF